MVRQGKKATHKCSRAEGRFSGPSKVQGPVSKPNSVSCHRQLNSDSLHKQTRWNPLSGDVRSPVEDHDLVPSLPDNTKSQTHSRVSEWNLLSRSNQVQSTEWSLHPQWNLSIVLNELTKAPFESMKDTDCKHLTLKTAFLLALASGKRLSKIHAWVANKYLILANGKRLPYSPLQIS